jgi:hypothetical protein
MTHTTCRDEFLAVQPGRYQRRPGDRETPEERAPVYFRDADGTATPVGITIRAADQGGTIAELIGPWPKRWSLSVDSS